MANDNWFNDDWLKLQQQYWENLTDMGRKAMGLDAPKQNPWEAAMDQWWKALSPAASDPSKVFMDRLMEQGKTYFSTIERLTRGLTSGTDATAGWDALNKTFEDMQRAFTGGLSGFGGGFGSGFPGGNTDDMARRMFGFWEMPLDNWQRMMSSLSPMMPGDLLRNMPHDQVQERMERMLSAPGLGYTREEQAQYQDLVRRTLDYQRALQEYMGFFGKLGIKSVERLRDLVQERAEAGEPIDSARTLYDSWVACCEGAYADEVSTPEYARIHGQLVNAQMALKKRMAVMVDETLGAMNMPTRSELRTLQDRMQETRRENKHLRRELDAIKRRLGEPGVVAASAPAAPKKKAVARKKTVAAKAGPSV
ncbi:MAG: class III poly(R)-hydroxyalkanoic acid synthase subunit PhaE [Thiohalocapsa sp.]|jgi:class III poly(R)-hydroxyalkanoic acid synthase PhaE subunit|uniref:class III poly(R)-hydroxyalkanoic acid synthase subunit PhaE n=1 Tax=Thiohalocapsa sp. TaxID=2497641 RepID=UPI0025D2F9ED|nr:class III poly(R)-hydroxyalkanoic acid synthase subunit PhaE [Thiohalocapsa sp.]MCG6942762.1 class III poly(R)-hydroxyalkanoic acid synthase subunit PhaE [Thiohalocapsa sp.]